MKWEAIGALGEVGGAIAVVVTLVYLARQIRASTAATRRAAMQAVADQIGSERSHWFSDQFQAHVERHMASDRRTQATLVEARASDQGA